MMQTEERVPVGSDAAELREHLEGLRADLLRWSLGAPLSSPGPLADRARRIALEAEALAAAAGDLRPHHLEAIAPPAQLRNEAHELVRAARAFEATLRRCPLEPLTAESLLHVDQAVHALADELEGLAARRLCSPLYLDELPSPGRRPSGAPA